MALLYISFFGIYLLLSGWLTDWAARKAKARGIAGWKWGLPMALLMYHLVFWDWVPTVVAHQYYCSKYGGFTVYKTLEEWKVENPGVAEGLVSMKGATSTNTENRVRHELNQRFAWDIIKTNKSFGIGERNNQIIDKKTGEMLASFVDYSTNISGIIRSEERNIRDYKVWMSKMLCEPDAVSKGKFYQFESLIERMGENRK
jgi:hypothetical protein